MTSGAGSPALSLMLDPSLKRARDLRLLGGVLCLIAAMAAVAIGFDDPSVLCIAAGAAVAGITLLVRRRRWAQQTARAEECARDASLAIATIIAETSGRGGLRRVTLRADGADASSDFTWLLPRDWGDVVRLDRAGTRVAVLAPVSARDRCVPLLRSGRPFVVPDYVATALIALLLEDIPSGERHRDVADLESVPSGTIPPPPPLPVTLEPTMTARLVWWSMVAASPLLAAAGVWLAGTGAEMLAIVGAFAFSVLLLVAAVVGRAEAVSAVVGPNTVELRGPFAWLRGTRRIAWDDVDHVSLRWISRATRQQAETHSLAELTASGVIGAVTGVDVAIVRTEIFDVGDAAARLLRGDIIPELDTLEVSLHEHKGGRLATYSTRRAFQPVRALLLACDERGIHVESAQGTPQDHL